MQSKHPYMLHFISTSFIATVVLRVSAAVCSFVLKKKRRRKTRRRSENVSRDAVKREGKNLFSQKPAARS